MKVLLLGVQLTSLVIFRGPLIRDLISAGREVVAVAPEPWLSRMMAMGASYIEAPLSYTGLLSTLNPGNAVSRSGAVS